MNTKLCIKQSQSLNTPPHTLSSPYPSQHNCWDFGTQCCKRYSWRGVTQASYFVIKRHFMIHGSLPKSGLRTSLLIFPLKQPSCIGLEMCVKGYPGGWTIEPYYNIYEEEWKGLFGLNKCLNTGPKSLSAQTCSSDIQRRENSLFTVPPATPAYSSTHPPLITLLYPRQ